MNLWCLYLAVAAVSSLHSLYALAPENEVPLLPTAWLKEGKVTPVHLAKGRTHRLFFTLQKKTLTVTVSPCSVTIDWSLIVHSLKNKPPRNPQWSHRKSIPEVWWGGLGAESMVHTYTGNAVDTYTGPAYEPSSMYIVTLRSTEQDTQVTVYLHAGPGAAGSFPELPSDPAVSVLGVGMTSVTLSWAPSPSITRTSPQSGTVYKYCVLVNHNHNYRSLCAANEEIRKALEGDKKREQKYKQGKHLVLPNLKAGRWQHWDIFEDYDSSAMTRSDRYKDNFKGCVCREAESVCTISDLLPDTQYYFDVFLIDSINATSVAYTGTLAHTHEVAQQAVSHLMEERVQRVALRAGSQDLRHFRFRPRGRHQNGLLTLQCCNARCKAKVSIFNRGRLLFSKEVGNQLAQIWLEGAPSYLIRLQALEGVPASKLDLETSRVRLKLQVSSAYHRTPPLLPPTLRLKSFNKLRSCSSVTLAWMGTEQRDLYCLYHRRIADHNKHNSTDYCLGPQARPATEQILCKYFQELEPRRAVTTAVIRGLDPGVLYVFDVYLMRRWGLPIKYHSKTVRTRREC
ncbi:protein NDNF isoform X2 [Brachyhypopomus gauderio]|uniref:protein NDNF isoform X2 n=1 Tax=Brachyhypopomus gauderio TaxID=698409 RepID=UPI0040426118